jgi:glutaredoxin
MRLWPKCRFCSHHKPPEEFIGGTVVGMCFDCYAWHQDAMQWITGERTTPRGCVECRRTYDELEKSSPDGDVRLALHRKDGEYQFLCLNCDAIYMKKRRDQFGSTPIWEKIAA